MKRNTEQNQFSAIKAKLVHLPGESLSHEMRDLMLEFTKWLMVALFAVFLPLQSYWTLYMSKPDQKSLFFSAVFSALLIAVAIWKCSRIWGKYKCYRLGRAGEIQVAQLLEREREKDWRIFNDVPGAGFNIDHIIVAPQGIFCIETKTLSKKAGSLNNINYDGETLEINGFRHYPQSSKGYLFQVMITSKNLQSSLEQFTGTRYKVQPVLVFPDRSVHSPDCSKNDQLWVINPKQLPAIIRTFKPTLSQEEQRKICDHLAKHIHEFRE